MAYNTIIVEKEARIAVITINRPPANALNAEAIAEIRQALTELEQDDEVRAIIFTGAGNYIFIAGADIGQFTTLDMEKGLELIKAGQETFTAIELLKKPVIAAINGLCLGGGMELAMACDFRIMADSAKMGQPEINLGIIPGWGGTQRLPRLVGKTRAMELLLTGDQIKSQDALRYGLVNKVVPDNELMATAKNIARRLSMQAPLAIAAIKKVVFDGLGMDLRSALALEGETFIEVFQTEDAQEGIRAFLGKRRPQFKGK
ncbi:MAG: enoyl-CoA hydratase-related protein [Bacillota bacterium]